MRLEVDKPAPLPNGVTAVDALQFIDECSGGGSRVIHGAQELMDCLKGSDDERLRTLRLVPPHKGSETFHFNPLNPPYGEHETSDARFYKTWGTYTNFRANRPFILARLFYDDVPTRDRGWLNTSAQGLYMAYFRKNGGKPFSFLVTPNKARTKLVTELLPDSMHEIVVAEELVPAALHNLLYSQQRYEQAESARTAHLLKGAGRCCEVLNAKPTGDIL